MPKLTNVGSGGASDAPYNQPARTDTSLVNDEKVISRHFSRDAGVLSFEDDAMTLIEMQGYVRSRLAH